MKIDETVLMEAEDFTRRLFRERHWFWAKPLVDALEKFQPTYALRWAIRIFQESLYRRRKAGSEAQQRAWLSELLSLLDEKNSIEYCKRLTFEIWNHDNEFNRLERAISRLWTALQLFQEGNKQDYVGTVITAVVMLAKNEEEYENWDEFTLEQAISLFHQMMQATGNGNADSSHRPSPP